MLILKNPNHYISECKKLKFNKQKDLTSKFNHNINQGASTSETSQIRMVNEIQNNNMKITTKLSNEYIQYYLTDLIKQEKQFLINSGSDMI